MSQELDLKLQLSRVADRVKKGALHLDEVSPHWFRHVDILTLDQSNPFRWVAAQVTNRTYSKAVEPLEILEIGEISGGFTAPPLLTAHQADLYYATLTTLWSEAVEDRKKAAHPST